MEVTYDGQHRLTKAQTDQTATAAAGCAPGAATRVGGYNQTYQIDEIGNFITGPAGAYTYPASGAGSSKPHAPTTAGGISMVWDLAGRMTSQTKTVTGTGGGPTTTTTAPATPRPLVARRQQR